MSDSTVDKPLLGRRDDDARVLAPPQRVLDVSSGWGWVDVWLNTLSSFQELWIPVLRTRWCLPARGASGPTPPRCRGPLLGPASTACPPGTPLCTRPSPTPTPRGPLQVRGPSVCVCVSSHLPWNHITRAATKLVKLLLRTTSSGQCQATLDYHLNTF